MSNENVSRAVASDSLTLAEALRRTRSAGLATREPAERLRAARHRAQAPRWPAPSASVDVENFGGDWDGARTETTLSAEQPFDLGGARSARAGLARSQATI